MHRRLELRTRAQNMREVPDPTPVEITVDKRTPSLREQLQAYVRQQISAAAQNEGYDSFEDEDDYEEDDPEDLFSPHELRAMHQDQEPDTSLETLDGTDDSPPPAETAEVKPLEASTESGGNG